MGPDDKGSAAQSLDGTFPYVQLVSTPRNSKLLDAREIVVDARDNISDIFMMGYEEQNTVIGIHSDSSDPNNPLHQIWKELIPDREKEINAEYDSYLAGSEFNLNNFVYDGIKSAVMEGAAMAGKLAGGFAG